jgi:predicted ATPase
MINSLNAQNLKSWESTGDIRLAPITAFFGTNSSGKSSILQLLLMLKQTAESPDRGLVLSFGDDPRSLTDLGDFHALVHGHKEDAQLSWSINWSLPQKLVISDPFGKNDALFSGAELGFKASVGLSSSNGSPTSTLVVQKMAYGLQQNWFGMQRKQDIRNGYELIHTGSDFHFIRTQGRVWDLPDPVKCYGFPDQVRAYFQNAGFLSDFEFRLEQLFSSVYYLGPLRAYPARQYTWAGAQPADMGRTGEHAIAAILASKDRGETISLGRGIKRQTFEEYIATWLQRLGLIDSFEVKRIAKNSKLYEVHAKKSSTSPDVLITDVGFGVSQILPVIVLCFYAPEGSTIILEQPEIHLHPAVQAGLADVLIDAAKNWNMQIILESHSEHLLRRLQRRVAENVIDQKKIALYFCDHDGQRSCLTDLELDEFGVIKNWPKEFFGDEFGEIAATNKAALDKKKSEVK